MAQTMTGSVSWDGGSATYNALSHTNGSFCLFFLPAAPEEQVFRHHIPGTNGNIKVLGGRTNQQLRLGVRYTNADVASAISAALNDFDSMAIGDCDVTAAGSTWERCQLRSALPLRPARPTGRSLASADYELIFDCDD
jgi:hypothetical protein